MARKYLVSDKNGRVAYRKVSQKNLKANYNPRALSGGRVVYSKVIRYGDTEGVAGLYSRKYKIRPGYQKKAIERIEKRRAQEKQRAQEVKEGHVEVKGLVSGEYKIKEHYFHCEMLFFWYGNAGFDEKRLLERAYDIMIDAMPEVDRINYELLSSEWFGPDYQRWGVESVNPYGGGIFEQMEFEIFIPGSQSGRVVYSNMAWVSL